MHFVFQKVFHCPRKANFSLPAWIPILPEAKTEFDLEPPTYQEVSRIIWRMKSSKSPCPIDQISVIMLKRCPFLRTYLSDIINHVWSSKKIPTTILIHRKGSPDDPSAHLPKNFTSILRNRMFKFLTANGFIENHIQKGFVPKISGTMEHTALLAHIIRDAKRKDHWSLLCWI